MDELPDDPGAILHVPLADHGEEEEIFLFFEGFTVEVDGTRFLIGSAKEKKMELILSA